MIFLALEHRVLCVVCLLARGSAVLRRNVCKALALFFLVILPSELNRFFFNWRTDMPWADASQTGAFASSGWRLEALEAVLDRLGIAVTLLSPASSTGTGTGDRDGVAASAPPTVLFRNRAAVEAVAETCVHIPAAGSAADGSNSQDGQVRTSYCPRPSSRLVTHDVLMSVRDTSVNLCVSESVSPVSNPVLGAVLEAAPRGTWISLPMGEVEWSSSYIQAFTGFSAERALGQGWQDSLHPDDVCTVRQAWQTALSTGEYPEVEARITVPGGGWRYVAFSCKALRDPVTGAVLRWVGIMSDVHERRLLQDKLQAEQTLFLTAIDQLPVSVVVADAPSGAIRLANQRTFEMWNNQELAASLHDYSQYRALHPDGRPYVPTDWPLARSILYGEVITKEDTVFERW